MERLTHKIVYDNEHCQYMFDIDQDSKVGTKLGELEDILESWHIESLEELKTRLHDCQVYHLKNNSNETLIHNLKNELAELKQTQKQLAIEELEKLREYIVLNDEYDEEIGCNIIKTFGLIEDLADKIKSLKGED